MTVGVVYLCGNCRSPSVSYSSIKGGQAVCRTCGWKGHDRDLIAAPFQHDFLSDEGMVQQLTLDLRNTLAKGAALPIAEFLSKWGFLNDPPTAQELGRFISAAARGILKEVVQERENILNDERRELSGGTN